MMLTGCITYICLAKLIKSNNMRKLLFLMISLLLFNVQAWTQTKEVTGKVTDAKDGSGISGASITVKGSRIATKTDDKGFFKLSVPSSAKTLIITSIGFKTTEVAITEGMVDVALQTEETQIGEIVVTGYSTKTKRSNTGSAVTVAVDDIRNQPIASFDQLLQGQAAGLNVKAGTGQPGRGADVVIRGQGSINGATTPLYIIDGVEVRPGDFSTMNPGDFESVTVLKDAASTSIYGSRGANGVIVVTTKKGKSGRTKFSYDAQFGISRLPKNKLELMNTQEKLDFEIDIAGNPWGWTPTDVTELRKINTDWNDIVFRDGKVQSHQLSASGGTDKTTFYTSFGTYNEEGITINTGIKRYTGRLNIAHAENRLKMGINLTGGWSNFRGTGEGNQSVGAPLNTVLWALPYEVNKNPDGSYYNSIQFPFWLNPEEELNVNGDNSWQLKSTGNIYLEYKIPGVKNLTYRINAGGDFSQIESFAITNNGTQAAQQSGQLTASFRNEGILARGYDRRFRGTITNSLVYKTFLDAKEDHNLTAGLYTEYIRRNGRSFNFEAYGLLNPFRNEAGLVAGTAANGYIPVVGGGFPQDNAISSFFGNVDYSFKNKYFLSLSGRTDGSSRLSPDNRWTQYGSVGAAWILSEEDFLRSSFVNFLKLKASYGAVGNSEGIGDFPYLLQYGRGTYNGNGTLNINRLGNPELTWEKRKTANIGIDFEILKSRIRGTVEYYNSLTKGLYFAPFVPATSGGLGNILTNGGDMANSGIDLSLGFKIVNGKNFRWSIDANYNYNKNTIKSLPNNQDFQLYQSFQALKVGKPFGSFYLVEFVGVNPANGNSQYRRQSDKSITEIYDANDLTVLGTSYAPHTGGLTNTISFKGLELSTFFVFNYGNYVYNNARFNVEFYQYTTSGFAKNGLKAWTTPGQITNFPRIDEATEGQTTRFLEKGDFWRLRNVMLSYTFPTKLLGKIKIQGLRIFVQGQNLYTFHNFQGWDPEVSTVVNSDAGSNAAVSGAQYPVLRSITAGINVTF
jgi:TonB-dependent starch-binding outer membrane protein SusC